MTDTWLDDLVEQHERALLLEPNEWNARRLQAVYDFVEPGSLFR